MNRISKYFYFASFAVLAVTQSAFAAERQSLGLAERVSNFYSWALGMGGILALGILIYAGILYTSSAGNASRISEAKKWIWAAAIGLIVLFGSYTVLNTINPGLLVLGNIEIEELQAESYELVPRNEMEYLIPIISGETTIGPKCRQECISTGQDPLGCSYFPECRSYEYFAYTAKSFATANKISGGDFPSSPQHLKYISVEPKVHKTSGYPNCYGADCGVYVSSVVKATIDPNFPSRGTILQRAYLEKNPNFKLVNIRTDKDLKPGDILLPGMNYCQKRRDGTIMPCGTGHIAIWLDNGEYEAAYSSSPKACGNNEYLPRGPRPQGRMSHMTNAFRYVGF